MRMRIDKLLRFGAAAIFFVQSMLLFHIGNILPETGSSFFLGRSKVVTSLIRSNATQDNDDSSSLSIDLSVTIDTSSIPSPLCYPSLPSNRTIKRIFLAHMRKAGGSTLRSYLKHVANELDLKFEAREGKHFEVPGSRSDTLYVTHIRDPVARTLSHFKYEGRWKCETLKNKSFVPSQENAMDFNTWIQSDVARRRRCSSRAPRTWKCSENCFVRWLVLPYHFCPDYNDAVLEQMALQRALGYHLIIRMELLKNSSYAQEIEHFFSVEGLDGFVGRMDCDDRSRQANHDNPLEYDSATLDLLHERSRLDYRLLERLADCPNEVIFPNKTLLEVIDT